MPQLHYFSFIHHQDFSWQLPDFVTPIGVNGCRPSRGIAAADVIGPELDNDGRLGDIRGHLTVLALCQQLPPEDVVLLSHYRRFLMARHSYQGPCLNNGAQQHGYIAVSPQQFSALDPNLLTSFPLIQPPCVFLSQPLPIGNIVSQYHSCHAVEDLLRIIAELVSDGVLPRQWVPGMLSRQHLHYALLYGASVGFMRQYMAPVLQHVIPLTQRLKYHREGYNERFIAFSYERVLSEMFFQFRQHQEHHQVIECDMLFVDDSHHSAAESGQ